jgi:peptidoglycan hydrolase-like protein with peptidoglycan-binding domain
MRLWLTATLMFVAAGAFVQAQTTAAKGRDGARPKSAATAPVGRPALQTPTDTANAMAPHERLALQSDLAWVGEYNGVITGDVSERMVAAIKEYQKNNGGKPTGVLNPQERAVLAETARRRQETVGWKIVTETVSGARLGIPTKLVPQQTSDANGTKWSSPTATIQVWLTRRKETNPTTAKLADREKKDPPGRRIDYTVVKPDFFVLSGLQNLKKFYLRGTFRDDEVRIMTILYDQATENTVEPIVVAMSSAFNAFPSGPQGPAPRKAVEYSTGIVVTEDGAILADRDATDACQAIAIQGLGRADRVVEDRDRGLTLLHIYGARGLKPLALADGAVKASVEIVGIADPQNQAGGAAVTVAKAQVTRLGAAGELMLSPAPAVGFSGAPALDDNGKFAGVASFKPVLVATTAAANAAPASQSVLVTGETVREFLRTNQVAANGTSTEAKAAIVRVICVRK